MRVLLFLLGEMFSKCVALSVELFMFGSLTGVLTAKNINHMLKNVATFEEAVKVKHYIINECWIITCNDFYGNETRMKKITRVKLELIGKTDE